jgi:hypothetical protein
MNVGQSGAQCRMVATGTVQESIAIRAGALNGGLKQGRFKFWIRFPLAHTMVYLSR